MCGHAMVPPNLVKSLVEEIKQETKSPEEAAKELAVHCCCGIFNPTRAAKLLTEMVETLTE